MARPDSEDLSGARCGEGEFVQLGGKSNTSEIRIIRNPSARFEVPVGRGRGVFARRFLSGLPPAGD